MKNILSENLLRFICVTFCCFTTIAGCRKSTTTTASSDFSYSGTPLTYDSIKFVPLVMNHEDPDEFTWDFGDSTTSIDESPTHIYKYPGTKVVTLKINNEKRISKTIEIKTVLYDYYYAGKLSLFEPVSFHSTVPAGVSCEWDFGDGGTSTELAPTHVYTTLPTNGTGWEGNFSTNPCKVTLVVNGDAIHAITRWLYVSPGAERLTGMYHWTGGTYLSTALGATSEPIHDTDVAIEGYAGSSCKVWGVRLDYYIGGGFAVNYTTYLPPDAFRSGIKWNGGDTIFLKAVSSKYGTLSYYTLRK